MQVNKAQYKEADCAKELKRNSIASFFAPSPKKKVKQEADDENAPDASKNSKALQPSSSATTDAKSEKVGPEN